MDEIQIALQIEEVAKIISGAPFPSKKSLSKARGVVEFLSNRAALTVPEGFVLVPAEPPTREMWFVIRGDGLAGIDPVEGDDHDSERHKQLGWFLLAWTELMGIFAARPEVK